MGEIAARYMSFRRKPEKKLPPEEAKALDKTLKEAAAAGATLHSNGQGGLPPSMVLGVLRRDQWRCKRCGGQEDLSVHHKGGVVSSKYISRMGHKNVPGALAVICHSCHDAIHDQARAEGIDSSQVLAEGDEGTKHDHGQPLADPEN